MNVNDVLKGKTAVAGNSGPVATVKPDDTVADAVAALREHNIGALVVTSDGSSIVGVISERDVVRRLAEESTNVLARTVSEVMSTELRTCTMTDELADLARQMTDSRIRHLIVTTDDEMVGIISIGDVVKSRLDQLEYEKARLAEENEQITEYILWYDAAGTRRTSVSLLDKNSHSITRAPADRVELAPIGLVEGRGGHLLTADGGDGIAAEAAEHRV